MIPYIVMIGITILTYSALCKVRIVNVNKGKLYITIIALTVILLLGLRHPSMGADLGYGQYYGYLGSFQTISEMSWKQVLTLEQYQNYERGYIIFNKLIGMFSTDEQFYLLICAMVSFLPIAITVGKYSKNCRISFLIYFGLPVFLVPFSAMRQAVAVAITFWGYGYIKQKQWKPYILLVLFASLFHATALVAIFAYPLYWMKMDRGARLVTLGTVPVLFVLRSTLWNLIVRITGRSVAADHNGAVMLFLLFVAIYIYTIIFSREKSSHDGLLNLLYACCCILALTEISQVVQRVAYYFMPYMMLLLPEVLDMMKQKWDKGEYALHTILVTGGFLMFFVYNLQNNSWAMAYPYYFFWQNVG